MIRNIHISNYALIESLEVDFASGFNIITGETGAGKSIILGALSLLMGGRADLRAVRDNSRKSVIEAQFELADAPAATAILAENGFDSGDGMCILRRELLPGGRSRAFVNDTPANLQQLRQVAIALVDIHSQHQNLQLASGEYQLEIIDSIAGNAGLLEQYHGLYAAYRRALGEFTRTREMIRRNGAQAEYIEYQYRQLAELELKPGESATLERERTLLADIGDIKTRIRKVLDPLSENPSNALASIRQALAAMESLAAHTAEAAEETTMDIANLAERLQSARAEVADIAESLAAFDAGVDADPERLEEIDARLADIYSMESKHHVRSTDELIALAEGMRQQLETLADSDATISALETAARRAKKAAVIVANELSARRAKAAEALAAELRATAMPLGLPNLRCEFTFSRGKLGSEGYDQVLFLAAFNKNQALMPVGTTASGGEISRLMLALKSIVASRMQLPSLIFDEVDTGVSGDIAVRMAQMMAAMASGMQVITITHLPGVAAMGRRHFKVFKQDNENSTTTRVRQLAPKEREAEIALMLSGDSTDEASLGAARALLAQAEGASNK